MHAILLLIAAFVLWISLHAILFCVGIIILWIVLHRAAQHIMSICRNCGTQARSVKVSPRNLFIEILLWFVGLIPGVLYTLWCNQLEYEACAKCKSRDIVPVDSPVGRKLMEQHTP